MSLACLETFHYGVVFEIGIAIIHPLVLHLLSIYVNSTGLMLIIADLVGLCVPLAMHRTGIFDAMVFQVQRILKIIKALRAFRVIRTIRFVSTTV